MADDDVGYVPPVSQAQYAQKDALESLYNRFKDNEPSLTQDLYSNETEKANRKLADTGRNIRAGASQRGLLYSGLREGAEGAARGQSATDLASSKANINEQMMDTRYRLGSMAAASGLDVNAQELERSQARYNLALRQAGQRADVLGGVFGAAGLIGGAALASKMGSNEWNQQPGTNAGSSGGGAGGSVSQMRAYE